MLERAGLALNFPQDASTDKLSLFFSLESKGTISKLKLPPSNTSVVSAPPARVVLRGLRSPRGLVVDSTMQMLFFTEKTGRIYLVELDKTMTARQKASVLPDDASIDALGVNVRRVVTQPSMTRLDGIAVDTK